jgi:uncharacterized spore protein YtfJ
LKKQAGPVSPPLRIETVRGTPYEVAGRRLVPVARIVSFGQGRATIGRDRLHGWAGGFARVVPLGVIEETEDGQRYVPIRDATGKALRGILASAVVITLLAITLWRLIHRGRGR